MDPSRPPPQHPFARPPPFATTHDARVTSLPPLQYSPAPPVAHARPIPPPYDPLGRRDSTPSAMAVTATRPPSAFTYTPPTLSHDLANHPTTTKSPVPFAPRPYEQNSFHARHSSQGSGMRYGETSAGTSGWREPSTGYREGKDQIIPFLRPGSASRGYVYRSLDGQMGTTGRRASSVSRAPILPCHLSVHTWRKGFCDTDACVFKAYDFSPSWIGWASAWLSPVLFAPGLQHITESIPSHSSPSISIQI